MKEMNKIILAPIFVLVLALIPHSVMALSDQDRYNVGFNDGVNDAQQTTNTGGSFNDFCDTTHHTDHYCNGYKDGYAHYWNTADHSNVNFSPDTQQKADVNVKGDNNKVTINQQTNNQFGSNDGGSSDGHHHSNGQNPSCVIFCGAVKVN